MATAWRIWVGTLVHRGLDISVPAFLQRYDDANPPPPDGQGGPNTILAQWDVSTAITTADASGHTNNEIKMMARDRVVESAEPIKDLWETWEAVGDLGNKVLPGWPT